MGIADVRCSAVHLLMFRPELVSKFSVGTQTLADTWIQNAETSQF